MEVMEKLIEYMEERCSEIVREKSSNYDELYKSARLAVSVLHLREIYMRMRQDQFESSPGYMPPTPLPFVGD